MRLVPLDSPHLADSSGIRVVLHFCLIVAWSEIQHKRVRQMTLLGWANNYSRLWPFIPASNYRHNSGLVDDTILSYFLANGMLRNLQKQYLIGSQDMHMSFNLL